jgi:hypothetical protein
MRVGDNEPDALASILVVRLSRRFARRVTESGFGASITE